MRMYGPPHKCNFRKTTTSRREYSTFRLRCLLVQSAVRRLRRLTAVRHVMSRDYSSTQTIITTDYEALYAFKCGVYERCTALCEDIINCLMYRPDNISVLKMGPTDLMLLMDDDCRSFAGIVLLGPEYWKVTGRYCNLVTL